MYTEFRLKASDMLSISSKSQYGIRAMVFLTKKDRLVSIADIAEIEHIPYEFLEKIVQQLKKSELLLSERGARGGYALAKDPEEITFKDILIALGDLKSPVKCLEGSCEKQDICGSKAVWGRIHKSVTKELESITLDQIAQDNTFIHSISSSKKISCSQ